MKYYFIYSAGGGAGDWNGIKRIWKDKMPTSLKKRVLLKFGDVFFNHASLTGLIKHSLWNKILNLRSWLSNAVGDPYVNTDTKILLDSGTSKIVNIIATNISSNPNVIIEEFHKIISKNSVIEKYAEIIKTSNIELAVSFDIPNPFKIRAQSANTATSFFNNDQSPILISRCAEYSNKLYSLLGNDQARILTTINGQWSTSQLEDFFSQLDYSPNKIAVGGVTRARSTLNEIVRNLNNIIPFRSLETIHFLGCGGIQNGRTIKNIYNADNISVDNSTPMNRAIDGSTDGNTQSGYFDYINFKLHRIKQETINKILELHDQYSTPIYSTQEIKVILDKILLHQSGNSNTDTYDARAQLSLHNHDVFRVNSS